MTGLDANKDVIVEIATLITNDELEIIAEGPDLVIHTEDIYLNQMNDVVKKMHTQSGLLEAIKSSQISLEQAGQQTLEFLKAHIEKPHTVPLCGNSISTDRKFLLSYLPEVEDFFHYRNVDVSTIKELCKRWYPKEYVEMESKSTKHRALDDIKESIEELILYRKNIFKPTDNKKQS